MITNNNFSVLPWYSSLQQQHHRKKYAYGQVYTLPVSTNRLIPFQVLLPKINEPSISSYSIQIYDLDDNKVGGNRINSFISSGLALYSTNFSDYSALVYTATNDLDFALPFGQYYFEISDGATKWYSDVFTVTDISSCVKVEWWDSHDFIMDQGVIFYGGNFRNILYIDTQIGRPKYTYEEEGDDRDGIFFAEKQISEKVYNFNFLGPEFICDVTRFIRLSDNVLISDENGVYNCTNIVIEVDWLEQGDLAVLSTEFKVGTVAKKIAPGFDDYDEGYNDDYSID